MSHNRFDRKRKPEEWRSDYQVLGGGLDLASSGMAVKSSRLAAGLNFEEVAGQQGYRTIRGYERIPHTGAHMPPSEATFWYVPFNAGVAAVAQGTGLSNGGQPAGEVYSQTVTSGSFGGLNAAGYLLVIPTPGTTLSALYANGSNILVGGVTKAVVNGTAALGTWGMSQTDYATALTGVRTYLRTLIGTVAGLTSAASICGLAVFNKQVYAAVYDNAGAGLVIYRSNTGGTWTKVDDGRMNNANNLSTKVRVRFWVGNFKGATQTLCLYGVVAGVGLPGQNTDVPWGASRMFRLDASDVFTFADPVWGTESVSTTANNVGLGAKTWTAATGKGFTVGMSVQIWNDVAGGQYMNGTVTAYNTGTGQLDVTVGTCGTAGGPFAAWYISDYNNNDKPFDLLGHKNHMFWAYPNGQLQTSDLGEPMKATTTASLFGLGDVIVGLLSLRKSVLAVFTRTSIQMLNGSSATDFALSPYGSANGVVRDSIQQLGNNGNAIYMDANGVNTLQATQAFGDFAGSLLSENVKRWLTPARLRMVTCSRMSTDNTQYRVYFTDGWVLMATIDAGIDTISPKDVHFTLAKYATAATCVASGLRSLTGDASKTVMGMFFGTAVALVMQEGVGTSMDGAAIDYAIRLHGNTCKSPQTIKSWLKLETEFVADGHGVTINVRQLYDNDDGTYTPSDVTTALDVPPPGGIAELSAFDTVSDGATVVRVESPLDGQGRVLGLVFSGSSAFHDPVTIQGVLVNYALLGLQR